jgi:hypothetical protein
VCSPRAYSIDGPGAEHRSYPITLDTATTRLVITRTQALAGCDRVELRLVVDLPTDPRRSRQATSLVVAGVRQAAIVAQLRAGRR